MKFQFPAINLRDYFTPLAVWELQGKYWRLLRIERPPKAIILCQKSPKRLAFPTGINPTGILGGVCVQCSAEQQEEKLVDQTSKAQKTIRA